jgi:hypothetical protein
MPEMLAGTYEVQIIAGTFGENANGKTNVTLDFRIIGRVISGSDDLEDCGDEVRSVSFYFVSEQNTKISIETLRAIGWEGDDFTQFVDFGENKHGLLNKTLKAKCKHEGYTTRTGEHRTGENWSFVTSNGGGLSGRMTAGDKSKARELNAKYGSILKGTKPGANSTPPAARTNTRAAAVRPAPAKATPAKAQSEDEANAASLTAHRVATPAPADGDDIPF